MSMTDGELFTLRQRVDRLERQVAYLMHKTGLRYVDQPLYGASPEILALLQQGRKLDAIKLYRKETGVDLKSAKEFIDSLET